LKYIKNQKYEVEQIIEPYVIIMKPFHVSFCLYNSKRIADKNWMASFFEHFISIKEVRQLKIKKINEK
jgi:hypothetical protein